VVPAIAKMGHVITVTESRWVPSSNSSLPIIHLGTRVLCWKLSYLLTVLTMRHVSYRAKASNTAFVGNLWFKTTRAEVRQRHLCTYTAVSPLCVGPLFPAWSLSTE
jgi:hypothetical protein